MKLIVKLIALLLVIGTLLLTSCDQYQPRKSPQSTAVKIGHGTPHRFVLTKFDGGVAFDTQTGQICRTWDWQLGGKPSSPDPQSGTVLQRSLGEFAPTCLSLYQQYPSSGDFITNAAEDDQSPQS